MKNYRRNNCIGKMKKGFKQKLSLLMIACLLFTGYQGLTISGRADSFHPEQNNEIEVSGSQVKVQLLGADLRRAATEAILKGEKVGKTNLRSYSKDQELATEFEEYFDGEKEIYNIPLNSIAENLEESLNAEEAGLQIYVERDAKNLEKLVRKESKESLLLYSKESTVAGLLPKKEEATTVSLTGEEKASDSNLERNTELTGSELITFVYENKSTERMTFQLSVDGNKYPKVTVSSKTSLFKQFLSDAKKAQAEAKNAKATEAKPETSAAQTAEATKAEVEPTEAKQKVAEVETTEESKASEEAQKDSDVAIVSTAAEAIEGSLEATEAKAEEKVEASEEVKEEKTEAPVEEAKEVATEAETTKVEKATEAVKASAEDTGLLKEITEHSEEFLPELHTVRFTQYSLNELGRKSQNVEVEGFGNVQVFYEEAAFDSDVVLEAKRLFKLEEEVEGEKLTEKQANILKEKSLYEDSASLDIRFVDRKDNTTEVEPKSPVSVRITIEKKALPEEAKAEDISIHHIVEEEGHKTPAYVETVSRSDKEKNNQSQEIREKEETKEDSEDKISKEFTVSSFSTYVVHWGKGIKEDDQHRPIRIHYVDEAFNEIAPTIHADEHWLNLNKEYPVFEWDGDSKHDIVSYTNNEFSHSVHKRPYGYGFKGVYAQGIQGTWKNPETAVLSYNAKVLKLTNKSIKVSWEYFDNNEQKNVKGEGTYELGSRDCVYRDIYFVYKVCLNDKVDARDRYLEPSLIHDKYITKFSEDKYELTLTGEVKRGNKDEKKQPVDIVFVYDNTGNITESDSIVLKNSLYSFIDDLSSMKNSYDARFALITMDGEDFTKYDERNLERFNKTNLNDPPYDEKVLISEEVIQGHNIAGSLGEVNGSKVNTLRNNGALSSNYSINDKAFNDSRNNYAFTSSAEDIKAKIKGLRQSSSSQTGANYYAAIRNVKALMQVRNDDYNFKTKNGVRLGAFDNKENFDAKSLKEDNTHLVRDEKVNSTSHMGNAKKVVIFIAGGNATRTYVKYPGNYEDYIKKGDEYFLTRAHYEQGQSIGNGKTIYYPALNDARAELWNLNMIDAFYSVGIGNKDNWSHLNELAMGKEYENGKKRTRVLANGIDYRLYEGTNADAIKRSFKDIRDKVATAQVQNIVINDTLSQYVKLIDGDNSIKGKLYKKSGLGALKDKEINKSEWPSLGLKDIIVEQKEINGKTVLSLKTDPDNFVLKPGYEIRLIAEVKPTEIAYDHIAYPHMRVKGQDRTDLNKIYKDDGYEKVDEQGNALDPEKYATSVEQLGLYTNDNATISFKYKDPKDSITKTPPSEEYNKPIITVREKDKGYLKVHKGFVNFDKKLYNEKTQEWTTLGKHVLKNVEFDIKRKLPNGQEELITTVNLGDDRWINGPITTSLQYELKDGAILKINPVVVEKDDKGNPFFKSVKKDDPTTYHGYRFGFEIDNLPKNTQYQVVERVLNKDTTFTVDGVKYKYQENEEYRRRSSLTEAFNNLPFDVKSDPHGNSYSFNNFYTVTEKPKVDITVKKIVQEFGGTAFTQEATNQDFEFYLGLYHSIIEGSEQKRKSYSKDELDIVVKGFSPELQSLVKVVYVDKLQTKSDGESLQEGAIDPGHYVIKFTLKHDHSITFPLKPGDKYRIYEKKEEGYREPKYKITKQSTGITVGKDVYDSSKVWYPCTTYTEIEESEIVTWYNPRITMVPTGLVSNITPYLFGIFGFVAMAGVYLTINKKRREA